MVIKVVDFEILTRHYTEYQKGVKEINVTKESFIRKLDPLKKEMEGIISIVNTNTDISEDEQKEKTNRFQEVQSIAMEIDSEFKHTMRKMNDELSKSVYKSLSSIINEWGNKNSIDMIIGSTEVVFLKEEHFVTENILEILRERNLFT